MRAATCMGLCVLLVGAACGPLELTVTLQPPGAGDEAPSDAGATGDLVGSAVDGGARGDDRAMAAPPAGDASSAAVDVPRAAGDASGAVLGPTCSAHDDCDEDQICTDAICVEGCLPEDEPCDPGGEERCCEHFHCCPVFHICVPNWWE